MMLAMRTALALAATIFAVSPAIADPLLQSINGQWAGSGWAKRSHGAPRETVRCRITNTYQPDKRRLWIDGKCAAPGRASKVRGYIDELEGTSSFSGRWSNPFGAGSTVIRGRQSSNRIKFRFRIKDPETDQAVAREMIWRI